jgi:hypothetical protein
VWLDHLGVARLVSGLSDYCGRVNICGVVRYLVGGYDESLLVWLDYCVGGCD